MGVSWSRALICRCSGNFWGVFGYQEGVGASDFTRKSARHSDRRSYGLERWYAMRSAAAFIVRDTILPFFRYYTGGL